MKHLKLAFGIVFTLLIATSTQGLKHEGHSDILETVQNVRVEQKHKKRVGAALDNLSAEIQSIIYNALDGMMVYEYIDNSLLCVDNINYYIEDVINSTVNYVQLFSDITNDLLFEQGTFNFTNSLGRLSPILRNCYEVGGQVDSNWQVYWSQFTSPWSVYEMFKANVVRNYTDIDTQSSALYDDTLAINLPNMSFEISRLTFLFFFQTLVYGTTTLSSSRLFAPNVEIYPAYPITYDYVHLGSEYFYEFLSGTRLQDQTQLDRCQQNITDFSAEYHAAVDYYYAGYDADDFDKEREGVFRVADSFMRITNMTWQCYTVAKLAEYTITTTVKGNVFNPVLILANCALEFFYIVSGILAEFANVNYQDWLSFSYWLGDLVYRVLIVDHQADVDNIGQ